MTSLRVVGNVNAISLKFEWEINNFSTYSQKFGEYLLSPKFTANDNIQWNMQLYPNGVREDARDYLSLYLNANAEIKAVGTFIVFNNKGAAMASYIMDERVFGTPTGSWGRANFLSRDFVTNRVNGILNNDKLTIGCKITYKKTEQKVKKQEDDVPRLEDEYEALLNDSNFSDICLISEGKAINVHKCILASRSSVFAAMFNAEMKEKQENTVEIADIRYDVLVEMIRFVYARKVNNIDTLASELALAADKYALDGLKNTCEKTMIKNLDVDNVIDCVQLADRIHMDKLKEKAIEFSVQNARDVSKKPEFELLPRDIIINIFRCLADQNT